MINIEEYTGIREIGKEGKDGTAVKNSEKKGKNIGILQG